MKNRLVFIFTMVCAVIMLSSAGYGEWKMIQKTNRTSYYLDIDRIRHNDGYVYFWSLLDYVRPNPFNDLSTSIYA